MSDARLGNFLREASNWTWEEFVIAETDKKFTSNQAIIFSLIRACTMGKLGAIQMALNRLDGKLKTPVRVEYPKIYYRYPNAKTLRNTNVKAEVAREMLMTGVEPTYHPAPITGDVLETTGGPPFTATEERDLATMSLRETLTEMAEYPRELPEAITQLASQTEQWARNAGPKPDEIPKVKSVVAAHLLMMAQTRNLNAITEVFDQIDGKLVETIQLLGDDIYINNYSLEAPDGATPGEDGVLQLEATEAQNIWKHKLGG